MASALTFRWAGTAPYFDKASNSSNCIVNDHPTVAALHVLLERTLALPDTYGTAEQRTRWTAMQKILPPVPVSPHQHQANQKIVADPEPVSAAADGERHPVDLAVFELPHKQRAAQRGDA